MVDRCTIDVDRWSIDERIFRVATKERSNQVQGNSANGNATRVPFGGYLKCHSRAQASIKGHRSLCGETTVLFVGLVVRKINLPKIRTPPRSSRSCISLKRFKLLKPWNHVSPLSGEPRLTFHVTETGNFHRASIISELNSKLLYTLMPFPFRESF